MARSASTVAERFWAKAMPEPMSGCWLWLGAESSDGYGTFYLDGRTERAHRVALRLTGREVPVDRVVCHRCDNRICVNPEHLFVGTQLENVQDCKRKGRTHKPRGEANGRAKLSDAHVVALRAMFNSGRYA